MKQNNEQPVPVSGFAAKEPVRFEVRDWLALTASLGLAVLWISVFGFEALKNSQHMPALGACAFVAAIYAAVLLYLGKDAKWNVWNICFVSGIGFLTLACCIYGDVYIRLINFLLIFCGSAMVFFSLSGSAKNALWKVRAVPETVFLTILALFSNIDKPFRAAAGLGSAEKKSLRGVLVGLIIGLPVFILVIYLLSTADVVFGGLFKIITDWLNGVDAGRDAWRAISTLVFTLVFFSAIYFLQHTPERKTAEASMRPVIASAPFATVLILLDMVYIIFVVIQFAFLFGGVEAAAMNGGYAEYARGGFFQLVAVSAINLVAVLITSVLAEWRYILRALSFLLLALTCVILFSAFWRMRLYISAFGMSLLRAMTLWAMAFIAVCIVLAAIKVWKPSFRLWPVFAAVGLAGWIIFNFINIDARIASYNVDAYLDGRLEEVDIYYLAKLSPDVVPALEQLRDAASGDYASLGNSDFYKGYNIETAIDGARGFYYEAASWREWCWSYVRYR